MPISKSFWKKALAPIAVKVYSFCNTLTLLLKTGLLHFAKDELTILTVWSFSHVSKIIWPDASEFSTKEVKVAV